MANTFLQLISDDGGHGSDAFNDAVLVAPERDTRRPRPTPPPPQPLPTARRPDDEITGPEIPAIVLYERWRNITEKLADCEDLSPDCRHLCEIVRDAIRSEQRRRPKRTKR